MVDPPGLGATAIAYILPSWGVACYAPTRASGLRWLGNEPLFEKDGGFGAFHAAADGVQDAAARRVRISVEAEPVWDVKFLGFTHHVNLTAAQFEEALEKNHAQDFLAQQPFRAILR